jgi:hypothetical protein
VSRQPFPEVLRFNFELAIEITTALTLSAGELAKLIGNGLFALDTQAALFPGLTSPEERLLSVTVEAVGYERSGRATPIDEAYRRLMTGRGRPSRAKRELQERLVEAAEALEAAVLLQHTLWAKLHGLLEKSRHPEPLIEANREAGEALISAAERIAAAVETSAKSGS